MSLFRLDASIHPEGSASRALADIVEAHWRRSVPPATDVTHRQIGADPLPSDAWQHAVSALTVPADQYNARQTDAVSLARSVVDELVAADAYLFAVPLYNYGVSQHFKTYVDLVATDPRMDEYSTPATAGKPGVLVTVRGGNYSPGTPREGWDHATAWMRRILEDVWGIELQVVVRQFTLVGRNPALDAFTDIAEQLRLWAEADAHDAGRSLAARLSTYADRLVAP